MRIPLLPACCGRVFRSVFTLILCLSGAIPGFCSGVTDLGGTENKDGGYALSWQDVLTSQSPPTDSTALQRLRTWAESLQTGTLAQNGIVALSVRRVSDGALLFGQHERVSLSTASTLKLVIEVRAATGRSARCAWA